MRTLLLIFSLALCACGTYKPRVAPIALATVSGVCYGVHETVVHHPDRIPESWDKQWWDATRSWTNKYNGGNPANGEKFFGSTTFLAWTTDAKHLFGTTHRATLAGSAFTIGLGEKRPFLHYVADFGLSFVAFSIGFHATYSVAFNK